jgi:L-seryl-tRNA(Ser) seleniumtransferase
MLATPVDALRERARALQRRFPAIAIVDTAAFAGGGTLPLDPIASAGIAFVPPIGATAALARMRASSPPLIARIDEGRVIVDLRTVDPSEDARVGAALAAVFAAG